MSAYTHGLTPEQIDDFVNNTLHKFEKNAWVDISTGLQRYFAMSNALLDDRVAEAGGDYLQWQIKVRNAGSAKNTGMYAVDDVAVQDVSKNCKVPWTKQTCNMAYDQDEGPFQGTAATQILDLLRLRRHAALTDFAELMEDNFWGAPADSTTEAEQKKPLGVPYWLVRSATKGFNGGRPSGHTDVAGLDPNTYTRWKNFTGQYKSMSKRDLVRLMREATVKCNFRPPVAHPKVVKGDRARYVICSTYEVIQKMEELLEEQNTNLGNDLASKDGDVMFRRTPMTWVPWLDNNHDSTGADATNPYGRNPLYGIDRRSFQMVFKSGKFMKRTRPIIAPNQHSVRHIHWDSWTQFRCFDRRCNWLLTQAAA